MSSISEAFREAREAFRGFEGVLQSVEAVLAASIKAVLYEFAADIDRVESRTKEFISIRDNYVAKYGVPPIAIDLDEFLRDTNDLIGVRVVVYYNTDVDATRDVLAAAYPSAEIEEKLTVRDVGRGSRFGYRAVHVNFEFSDQKILKSQPRPTVGVEIQVRTVLSDAWARHSHKLAYKGNHPSSEEVLRKFALTAGLLENIDEQIDQIRLSPQTDVRKEVVQELSWTKLYDAINRITKASMAEDDVKSLYVALETWGRPEEGSDFYEELETDAAQAWAIYGDVDFVRYGIRDPLTQLKVALHGFDRQKYMELVPLHMRGKIADILQVGARKPEMRPSKA